MSAHKPQALTADKADRYVATQITVLTILTRVSSHKNVNQSDSHVYMKKVSFELNIQYSLIFCAGHTYIDTVLFLCLM